MLATPLYPSATFSSPQNDEHAQYRPAKDYEAFNSLLPPAIEFVEGSSSGALAVPEGKYEPINVTPKTPSRIEAAPKSPKATTPKSPIDSSPQQPKSKLPSLWPRPIDTTWPANGDIGSGLYNTGNTCFLNSALQCLLHTPPLLRVLIAHSQKQETCLVKPGMFCMSCAMRGLMNRSHNGTATIVPSAITSKMHLIAKHMRRGRQEDSHEFLRYAIDAMQKSCLAGYPPKLDPKITETTWVHKIFGGRLRSRVTCNDCGHNSDTFDSILDLSVDIHECQTLRDALRKFVAVDHLKGANKYKCEKCKKPVVAEKQFTVHDAPVVLTVHLKRFTPLGRKIGHPLRYDERLSLQPVMSEGQHGPTYSLYGVISHAGGGPNSGHYYAHVKSASGDWYEMNDDSVTRCHGTPTGMKNAYILFYLRDKGEALQAAVNSTAGVARPVSGPGSAAKGGVVANMKRRKTSPREDDEDKGEQVEKSRAQSESQPRPFIGPLLPDTSPETFSLDKCKELSSPSRPDPQAAALKRKIEAVKQKPSEALRSLSQYRDDDSDGEDNDKTERDDGGDAKKEASSSDVREEAEANRDEKEEASRDGKPPASPQTLTSPIAPPPTTSSPVTTTSSASIPAASFYGNSKKRKSPDGPRDDKEERERTTRFFNDPVRPAFSGLSFFNNKRPKNQENGDTEGRKRNPVGNPFSRLSGSDNLRTQRDLSMAPRPTNTYGKKKRGRMII